MGHLLIQRVNVVPTSLPRFYTTRIDNFDPIPARRFQQPPGKGTRPLIFSFGESFECIIIIAHQYQKRLVKYRGIEKLLVRMQGRQWRNRGIDRGCIPEPCV